MKRKLKIENGKWKIIILIGIAVFLGVAILNQQKPQHLSYSNPSPSPSPASQPRLLSSDLTEDERFILNPPPAEASRSAKDKHAKTVAKLAKLGNVLEIKDCLPTPLVLQVKQGTELTIKNNDSVKHKIIFDEEHSYEVAANGSEVIRASFKYGTGDYGYVCGGVGLVGFLHVVP